MLTSCPWCIGDPIYQDYHDKVWGVPVYDDLELFAKLILDGAQAGLSWITILKKQEGYYRAFKNFDAKKIACFTEKDVERLMQDSGIVRNRLKIQSTIGNAKAFLEIQKEQRFSDFLWQFVDGKPIQNNWRTMAEVPTETPESQAMSKALKKAGFKFVGPTICYAFMQAVGMVNDHLVSCPRHKDLK